MIKILIEGKILYLSSKKPTAKKLNKYIINIIWLFSIELNLKQIKDNDKKIIIPPIIGVAVECIFLYLAYLATVIFRQ